MKTKRRTLIVLLVFVLAAGAALTLLTHANQKAEQAASEAEDGSIPLLDVTTATLESVSIQYGGDTLTLRPSDDGWTLTEDPAYHLDDSACSTIRTALAGMKAKRQLEAQPGEDYGFDYCFIFQGQFFHFCSIHRDREVEDNLPNPVAIRLLFRE